MTILIIIFAAILLSAIGYGTVMIIKQQKENTKVKTLLKDLMGDTDIQASTFAQEYREKIKKRGKNKAESYKKIERILAIDPYQSLYYKRPQWLTIVIAAAIAIGVLGFYKFCFDYRAIFFYGLFPIATIVFARKLFGGATKKRRLKLFEQLPENLDIIIRAMKVGVPTNDSIKTVSKDAPEPSKTEFKKLYSDISVSMKTPADAFAAMAQRNQIPEYDFLSIAVSLQTSTGGSISSTLESVASVIKNRINIRNRGKALTGEARASISVLTFIPVFAAGAMLLISPGYILKLFDTVSGRFWLGISVTLIIVGQLIARSMLKKLMEATK